MSYSLVIDDSFQRANTSVGTGANSTTGVGNGAVDFVGNNYFIQSGALETVDAVGTNIPLNCLYYAATTSVNGKVRMYSGPSNRVAPGCVGRFTPANGGSGYGAFFYGGASLYIVAATNGSATNIVSGLPINLALSASIFLEMVVAQVNSTTTQITVNIYYQASPNTIIYSYSKNDTTAALQNVSGAFGVGSFYQADYSRVQIYTPSTVLSCGLAQVGPAYKTVANVMASASSGGTGTLSYQWYRSTVSGQQGSVVSGATNLNLADSGLTPGLTYYYTLVVTDQSPTSISYNQVSCTTISSNGYVALEIGDSITAGYGVSYPVSMLSKARWLI